ncbi:MAG: efflux RND transporter permease subunit [Myxococcota bacterium]
MEEDETRRGVIAWMTRNTVAANLLMAVLVIGGLVVGRMVKQEVFPEFEMEWIQVQVVYPGASPEEVEEGIVLAIEEEVRGLDGVKRVVSSAAEGVGSVYVEVLLGEDVGQVLTDVRTAVDRITSFPEAAERPIVSQLTNRREVLSVAIHGDLEEGVLKELAERFRDRLLQDDAITQVELGSTRPVEISVEVPRQILRTYGLTLDGIAAKVRRTAVQVPGGTVKTPGGEVLLRTDEKRDLGGEFRDIPVVAGPDGTRVLLGDVATIVDGFQDVDRWATFDGERAILVQVFRVGDETPLTVAEAVKEHMHTFEQSLPEGVELGVTNDRSEMYRDRMNLLLRNAAIGLVLVLMVLGLFLELRLAFWVTLGIPISFAGALLFMPAQGVSLNMISLFAFIVTLGIVVDDAIVVGENIYEYRQKGLPFLHAAIEGARHVAVPVTFSILTTVVAFSPLLFVPGFMGKFFGVIPAIVITVLLISLVESLFILPAHLSHESRRPKRGLLRVAWMLVGALLLPLKPLLWLFDRSSKAFSRGLQWVIEHVYEPTMEFGLRQRYLTLSVGLATLLGVAGIIAGGRISFSFMPSIESDRIVATAMLPFGSPAERTERIQARLVDGIRAVMEEHGGEEVLSRGIYARMGQGMPSGGPLAQTREQPGGHLTSVQVRLVPADQRDLSSSGIVDLWREEVGEIPGVEVLSFRANIGPNVGAPVDIQLSHRDVDTLHEAADDLAERLDTYAGVYDVDPGYSEGKPQLDLTLKPTARALGLTAADLASQVRSAFFGAEALRQQRGRDEVKVYVRLPESQRRSEHDIEALLIRTPDGGEIPLGVAAEVERDRAPTVISRSDGRRVVSVTSEVDEEITTGTEVTGSVVDEVMPGLLDRYPGLSYGFEGEQKERQEALGSLKLGFLLAMVVIYALLAIPFRSYTQPFVVMAAVPFGVVGAVIGHLIMGFGLSVVSMMGIVALAGVVVNDSLVLVHAANEFRHEDGMAPLEAVKAAGARRFRPILLTSLTTFFGLMPMILETSVQARFLIPMAVSLGFGILFATFIILGLVPAFYLIVEDVRRALGLRSGGVDRDGGDRPEPEPDDPGEPVTVRP